MKQIICLMSLRAYFHTDLGPLLCYFIICLEVVYITVQNLPRQTSDAIAVTTCVGIYTCPSLVYAALMHHSPANSWGPCSWLIVSTIASFPGCVPSDEAICITMICNYVHFCNREFGLYVSFMTSQHPNFKFSWPCCKQQFSCCLQLVPGLGLTEN